MQRFSPSIILTLMFRYPTRLRNCGDKQTKNVTLDNSILIAESDL